MTLEKAVITLTKAIENRYLPLCKDLDDATRLGIEALEKYKDDKDAGCIRSDYFLPGETVSS